MAIETEELRTDFEQEQEEEGGPVKSFLEHLEDLRWVLIKSAATIGVAMLLCLIAGNRVVSILIRPLDRATITYPGTNQIATVLFGTNRLGTWPITSQQQQALGLGTNIGRFVLLQIELTNLNGILVP